ncbi:YfcE family phosphodiesterase [Sporosarcina sp. P37]|uniref:metallophosphoesterase family protein n=1 Tax=unclassified Sporosarcina TaxID=2647733 RepID=UPI000A1797A9|nr:MULTISPECIES: metallophosphoesterase [unclassified Sporosarcina]ARK24303.1 YfcE family phosphodiesterase [Sporosarcina sp. P37]PID18419.1 metallophosphoesterase [Sporosarcina sp. P35]
MKVVITGDTHIPGRGKNLPARLLAECDTADLILHTGDWKSMEAVQMFSEFAVVKGVSGNADSEEVKKLFPLQQVIQAGDVRIGLVHGHGEKKTTEKRVIEAFEGVPADVIVFGHSHIPMLRYMNKTLLLNPGSPTDKRKLPHYSFAILHITEEIRAELVFFNDKT